MRNRSQGHQVKSEPILGEHAVRNAVILAVALAALLTCLIMAVLFNPGKGGTPDPQAEKAAAEARQTQALERLSIRFQVAATLWLYDHLKDPDSLETIQWTGPIQTDDGNWILGLKFRANNSFGGKTIESRIFTLDAEANVLDSQNIPPPARH